MGRELENNIIRKSVRATLLLLVLFTYTNTLTAQEILIDISHGQKFWNDPADMAGKDAKLIERINYMTGEIKKTAGSVKREVGYVKGKIQPDQLAKCDLLFIHIPSSKYEPEEITVIKNYLEKGGSLFVVMDANFWSTLEQTNVNAIISQYGIKFGDNSPDTLSGGYTKTNAITKKPLKITYHGGRSVEGGTPFCYNNQTAAYPFGAFTQVKGGGKIVAMGDGMVSLYMTSWKDVNDYQCQEFMQNTFAWLLKK